MRPLPPPVALLSSCCCRPISLGGPTLLELIPPPHRLNDMDNWLAVIAESHFSDAPRGGGARPLSSSSAAVDTGYGYKVALLRNARGKGQRRRVPKPPPPLEGLSSHRAVPLPVQAGRASMRVFAWLSCMMREDEDPKPSPPTRRSILPSRRASASASGTRLQACLCLAQLHDA
jgi:hypothetical protein